MTSPIPLRSLDNECWCEHRGYRRGQYGGYLYCSCDDGVRMREMHTGRRIKAANIPPRFADFTLDSHPTKGAAYNRIARVLGDDENEFFEKPGLYLWGGYGCGKTGLAAALLKHYCEFGEGEFVIVPDMLDRIRETYGGDRDAERELMDRWRGVETLVLDDVGSEKPSEFAEATLYKLVNHRHGRGDEFGEFTIFTSNLSLGQLAKRIGERTAWRIAEMCEVIHVEGPNLRDRK